LSNLADPVDWFQANPVGVEWTGRVVRLWCSSSAVQDGRLGVSGGY